MDEKTTPAPRRKRRGLRIFGIIIAVIILLLVIGYFVGTSEAFFKSVRDGSRFAHCARS